MPFVAKWFARPGHGEGRAIGGDPICGPEKNGLLRGFMTEYVELHARSAFSFLRGASTPEELIAACSELNMPAMALLDNDGVYGAARFHLAGQKLKVKAQMGAEITVSSFKFQVSNSNSPNQKSQSQN